MEGGESMGGRFVGRGEMEEAVMPQEEGDERAQMVMYFTH